MLLRPKKILRGGSWNKSKGAIRLSLFFPLACSWSWGIFLQDVPFTALELFLLSNKYIIYPMSCQDSFKVLGLLCNISKPILGVPGLRTASQFPAHFLVTLSPHFLFGVSQSILGDLQAALVRVCSAWSFVPGLGVLCNLLSCAWDLWCCWGCSHGLEDSEKNPVKSTPRS